VSRAALESELFGSEKGAFTGSVSQRVGRIELADQGTLFLDEIGEIAAALQPKLLRVLQEQEFERLGGNRTIRVNFRLIAASNRDLRAAASANQFRADLYYRLAVFPIEMPALRDRRDDLPRLVRHLVGDIARRTGKTIASVPKKTMDALMNWQWPGNVRELENFLERSAILTTGSVLAAPISELMQPQNSVKEADPDTLVSIDRQHILRALRRQNVESADRGCGRPAWPEAHHLAIKDEEAGDQVSRTCRDIIHSRSQAISLHAILRERVGVGCNF
jgi:formate hydrogenlyase transcriptional activator